MDKKYYWLKLKKDFFKRHDIKIIEDMENGKDYILFYLKLLCESVDHEGNLRFSETIPYNEKMLSTITNTNIDVVRSAMKAFTELNMIEILEDKTIFMRECERMLGCETYWAERKREQRKQIGQCPTSVQQASKMSKQEIDKELDKDIDINKERELVVLSDKPNAKQFVDFLSLKYPKINLNEKAINETKYDLSKIIEAIGKSKFLQSAPLSFIFANYEKVINGNYETFKPKEDKGFNERSYTESELNSVFVDDIENIEI